MRARQIATTAGIARALYDKFHNLPTLFQPPSDALPTPSNDRHAHTPHTPRSVGTALWRRNARRGSTLNRTNHTRKS